MIYFELLKEDFSHLNSYLMIMYRFSSRARMPSTRSKGRAQPTLQFPRRKSCRAPPSFKTRKPQGAPLSPPTLPQPAPATRIRPLSPRRPADPPVSLTPRRLVGQGPPLSLKQPGARLTPLSPRRPAAQPLTPPPAPRTRLPLSPRKRTGERRRRNSLFIFLIPN